ALLVVKSDVGRVRPGQRIRRSSGVCGRPRVTRLLGPARLKNGDLARTCQGDVQLARLAEGDPIRRREHRGQTRDKRIAMKLLQVCRLGAGDQGQPADHAVQGAVLGGPRHIELLIVLVEADAVHPEGYEGIARQARVREPHDWRATTRRDAEYRRLEGVGDVEVAVVVEGEVIEQGWPGRRKCGVDRLRVARVEVHANHADERFNDVELAVRAEGGARSGAYPHEWIGDGNGIRGFKGARTN